MSKYYFHRDRHNLDIYKLSSLCQHLEIIVNNYNNTTKMVLWEKLNTRMHSWLEAWGEDSMPTINEWVKKVWTNGQFTSFNNVGERLLTNTEIVFPNTCDILARATSLDITSLVKNILSGDLKHIRSKKRLLRMLKDIDKADFDNIYYKHEWFFIQHIKPLLCELERLNYRRPLEYYYY